MYGTNEQPFYGSLIQDNPSKLVLSQRRDLLEQPFDFMSQMSCPCRSTYSVKSLYENPVVLEET